MVTTFPDSSVETDSLINSGDSGLPTRIEVTKPAGFKVGPVRFTRPRVFKEPEGITFGYEKEAVLFVPVQAPDKLTGGPAEFEVSVTWLVCKQVCMLGSVERSITLETSGSTVAETPPAPAHRELLATHRARLPRPLKDLPDARFVFDGSSLVLEAPAGKSRAAEFFPLEVPGVTYGKPRIEIVGDRVRVAVEVQVKAANAMGRPMAVKGLLALGKTVDGPCYEFEIPVQRR